MKSANPIRSQLNELPHHSTTGIPMVARLIGFATLCALLPNLASAAAEGVPNIELRGALKAKRDSLMAAIARSDTAATAKAFTADAKFMVNGFDAVSGRPAIQRFWELGFSNRAIGSLVLTPADLDGESGELPVETGTLTVFDGNGRELGRSNYLLVWKREDGEWRIFRDIAASSSANAIAPASAPIADRVGFPKEYRAKFQLLRSFSKGEEPKLVSVYGNELAASVTNAAQLPYPYGSVFVVEYANSTNNPESNSALISDNHVPRGEVDHVDVMRRGEGFGMDYGKNRTGEWEYAGYHLDGTFTTPPSKSASCAECHTKAGAAKDFVFRGRF